MYSVSSITISYSNGVAPRLSVPLTSVRGHLPILSPHYLTVLVQTPVSTVTVQVRYAVLVLVPRNIIKHSLHCGRFTESLLFMYLFG